MKEQPHKYSILEKLKSLPMQEYVISRKHLPKALGVSDITFKKWLGIRLGDNREIPTKHLLTLAHYLNCKVEDLINEKPILINYQILKNEHEYKLSKQFKIE